MRPFISRIQAEDVSALMTNVSQPQFNAGLGHRLDSDSAPPPYDNVVDSLISFGNQTYLLCQSSQRLAEYLTVANGGPNASSPKAWNLHVSACVETALETLGLYHKLAAALTGAPAGSPLGKVHITLNLCDIDLLATAERSFTPVRVSQAYHLRSSSERRYLSLAKHPVTGLRGTDGVAAEIGWASAALIGGGLVGLTIYAGTKVAKHKKAPGFVEEPGLSAPGSGDARLVFSVASKEANEQTTGEKCESGSPGAAPCENQDSLRFGMLVTLSLEDSNNDLGGLWGSANEKKTCRIVHTDDRYRHRGESRAVTVKDRIMLKEEKTGKLLSRKPLSDVRWNVGFGLSDDCLWTVTMPM